jgi:alpha/beta superfamily hydrolase
VKVLVALGLPTHAEGRDYRYPFLGTCAAPKLFLSGDQDQFAPSEELLQVASTAAEPKSVVLIPGADHFFAGHLESMQTALAGWLKELAP